MGDRTCARVSRRSARSIRCRAGWPTPARRAELLGFEAARSARRRAARLVDWWRDRKLARSMSAQLAANPAPMIPIAKPMIGDEEAAAARGGPLGLGHPGPEVAAFEREFADYVGAPHACAVSNCTAALHLALLRRRRRTRRRGDHRQPLVHRHRQQHPLLRRDAGVRRHRARHLQHRPGTGRGGDHAAHAGDPLRAPDGHAVRPRRAVAIARGDTVSPSSRMPPAPSAARSASTARWERIGRPHGDVACFSFHPRKVDHHRRRRHAHDRQRRVGPQLPAVAPARHERARHACATAATQVDLRGVSRAGLQLPDDRHPGGGRARAAQATAGHAEPSPVVGRALPDRCWPRSRASACRASRSGPGATGRASAFASRRDAINDG